METERHPAGDRAALLIIDMVNDLEFENAPAILDQAEAASRAILRLRDVARRAGAPVVYVNDNFGRWSDDRRQIAAYARRPGVRGAEISRRLEPGDTDVFIIKPQHSGFYGTSLQVLLPSLGATRLVLTGMAADLCVLFTAADAHMRSYRLWTPRDCLVPSRPVASRSPCERPGHPRRRAWRRHPPLGPARSRILALASGNLAPSGAKPTYVKNKNAEAMLLV